MSAPHHRRTQGGQGSESQALERTNYLTPQQDMNGHYKRNGRNLQGRRELEGRQAPPQSAASGTDSEESSVSQVTLIGTYSRTASPDGDESDWLWTSTSSDSERDAG